MESEFITVNEASEIAGRDPETIREWYRKGWITKYQVGARGVRLKRSEVISFITPSPAVHCSDR
jgi:excisionase family DNA binding protein